jgi:hypothetical protein
MRTSTSSVTAAFAIAVLVATGSPAAAQTAEPAPAAAQAKPDAAPPARGELIEVDAEARTLTIMTASDTKLMFAYNDATQVSGAREGVAGLATMKNAQVAVHFTEDAAKETKTATRIEVQPRSVAPAPAPAPAPADPSPR